MNIKTNKSITRTCVHAVQPARKIIFLISVLLVLLILPNPHGRAAQISPEERFGYNQLETAAQKRAYTILEEQVGNVAESFVIDAAENITIEDIKAAADVLALDRPDFFYFIYGNLNIIQFQDGMLAVNPRYILHNKATPKLSTEQLFALAGQTNYTKSSSSMIEGVEETPGITLNEIRAAKQAYEAKIGRILQSIPAEADTVHEKVKYLHDYLANMITYQYTTNDQNAYSAIVEEKTVCAGYARAYQDLVTRLGIKCWYITGYAGEPHAWNVLWLNGECVYTDVTWGDQITYIQYGYYNISKEQMEKDHTMDSEYAAALGNCKHEAHKHKLTLENVATSIRSVLDHHFPNVGGRLTLNYSQDVEPVIFHSSDSSVAVVTDDGVVTMVGEGSAVVTVILENQGYAYQHVITVGASHQHVLKGVSEVPATCHSYGYKSHYVCTSCGKLFEDAAGQQEIRDKQQLRIPYNSQHGVLVRIEGRSATCTVNGKKDYWCCGDCGKSFFDSSGTKIIDDFNELLILATGHSAGSWQSDAKQHWKNCKECNQLIRESTASHVDADQNYRCDTCGYGLPVSETTPVQPTEPPTTKPTPTEPTQTEPLVTTPPATEPPFTDPTVTPTTEPTAPPAKEPTVEQTTEATEPPETDPVPTELPAEPTDSTLLEEERPSQEATEVAQPDETRNSADGKENTNDSSGATIAPTENDYPNDENNSSADLSVLIVATFLGVLLGVGMVLIVVMKRKK